MATKALAFILSIDELIFETATAGRTKYMMDNTEPFHLHKLAAVASPHRGLIGAPLRRRQISMGYGGSI